MVNDKYIELIKDKQKESYLRYKSGKPMLAYSSHQPMLMHMLNTIKNGSVLEFGVGYHSTHIMHMICGLQGRKLLSLETEGAWLAKFISYRSPGHELRIINKDLIDPVFEDKFAIAFVDGAPAELRQPFLMKIKADYIIVHDTEHYGNNDAYHYDFSSFNNVLNFGGIPDTTLLTNKELSEEILKMKE